MIDVCKGDDICAGVSRFIRRMRCSKCGAWAYLHRSGRMFQHVRKNTLYFDPSNERH